jgi:hypothetical protein
VLDGIDDLRRTDVISTDSGQKIFDLVEMKFTGQPFKIDL